MPWQDWRNKAREIEAQREALRQQPAKKEKFKTALSEFCRKKVLGCVKDIISRFLNSDEGKASKELLDAINGPVGAEWINVRVRIDEQSHFLTAPSYKDIVQYSGEFYERGDDGNPEVMSLERIAAALVDFYISQKNKQPSPVEAGALCESMLDQIRDDLDNLAQRNHN